MNHVSRRRVRAGQISLLSLGLSLALQAQAQQATSPDARQGEARTLDAVQVTGERTSSYTVPQTAAATRLSLTPQDTPQSLTVVTQQRIEDQNLQTVRDVLDNVTGVSSNAYDTERVVFYARGFQIQNMSYDGVPIASSLNSSSADGSLDTAIYDRIEILRGATGLLSGAGTPSASINFIRKHANAREFVGDASLSVGSWDTWRGTADLSAPLNQDGSVRGRFVAAYEQGGSYLDRYSRQRQVAYGVIDADLGPATTLSVGYDYQRSKPESVTWGSYPVFYDDGGFIEWRRGFNTSTDWSYWYNTTQTAFVDLKHAFGAGWQLRVLASHRRTDGDEALFYVYGFPNRETGEGLDPYVYRARDRGRQDNLDVYASGPFQWGGREHELVVGATGSRYRKTSDEFANDELAPVGNFLQWNGHYPRPTFADTADRATDIRTDQSGLYAAARLSLADPLKLIAGARYSRWKNDTDDIYSGVFRHEHNKTVPYAGLVYAFDPTWSAFASYTEIFDPQENRTVTGAFLEPVVGRSYEIGVKGRHFDGRLNSSLVLFDTRQDNVAEADVGNTLPDGMTQAYYAVDGTRSRGAELELSGDLSERWNASLGWSYFNLEGPDGEDLRTALPRTLFRVFTTYRLPGLEQLTIGGGANWQSASHALVDGPDGPQRVNQASVTLLSVMARYQFTPRAELQLNADNLLDRKYFVLDEYSNLYYAAPASATLSFRYRF
ncbi:TonB-dependent receptor [Stenotrophomonas panacihumi]|uniref:TonB-dependent receptor n=1 Tax=Stenotrophomonas panacihumi TaxID=676599 RepID=A0A0R0AMN4_9GAMM|nr:TonB-dependent siderophore receptor [Stenotrophomonas panacihumi]KRG42359.1 TonB-dependent receptor [Stenotrophomonas panacihumi]PTN54500.1 TonB-dependent siderophore receptor [Stenotrophomonas panacihumi]